MKRILIAVSTLLSALSSISQSNCWETGSCAYGLLESTDIKGLHKVEITSCIIRSGKRKIPKWKTTVYLDANGRAKEIQEAELCEKSPRYFQRGWILSDEGIILQELIGFEPGKPMIMSDAIYKYEMGRFVKKSSPSSGQTVSVQVFEWDSVGRILSQLSYYEDTISKVRSNTRMQMNTYDSLGRVSTYSYSFQDGIHQYELRYEPSLIWVEIDIGDPTIRLREEFLLNPKGLPVIWTKYQLRSKRWVPTSEVKYAYFP